MKMTAMVLTTVVTICSFMFGYSTGVKSECNIKETAIKNSQDILM